MTTTTRRRTAAPAAAAPAAPAKVKPKKQSFLSAQQVEDVDKDTKADDRYITPSKLPENKPQRYRIFGSGITGYEAWLEEGESSYPVRWRMMPDELPANVKKNEKGKNEIKRFIFAIVWDYQRECFGILQLTQVSLIRDLLSCINDEADGGEPHLYDIKIIKTGTGLQTKYKLTAGQIRKPKPEIAAAFKELYCNLEGMFDDIDPWDPEAKAKKRDEDDDLDDDEDEDADEEAVDEDEEGDEDEDADEDTGDDDSDDVDSDGDNDSDDLDDDEELDEDG